MFHFVCYGLFKAQTLDKSYLLRPIFFVAADPILTGQKEKKFPFIFQRKGMEDRPKVNNSGMVLVIAVLKKI